jgi:VanZ family protein
MKTTLLSGLSYEHSSPLDIALNVLGFVPLGFVIAWRKRRGIWIAIACGVALSLLIELSQPWIPGRDSSMIDWLCNGAGALAGGLIAAVQRQLASKIATL